MSDSETPRDGTEPSSDFQDRSISCVDCGAQFVWTVGEQVFFHDKGLKNEPKRCKPCKQAKNDRLAAISAAQVSGVKQRIEVPVTCAQCGDLGSAISRLVRTGWVSCTREDVSVFKCLRRGKHCRRRGLCTYPTYKSGNCCSPGRSRKLRPRTRSCLSPDLDNRSHRSCNPQP